MLRDQIGMPKENHFTDDDIEAQRGEVTNLRSHSKFMSCCI